MICQLGSLSHNNEVLHENTHKLYCHMYTLHILSNVFTNMYADFSHEICVDFKKKESIVCWCCYFKLATYIYISYWASLMCNFITYAWLSSDGLSVKFVSNNWAWCWAFVSFRVGGGLSSNSQESKGFALRSELGGSILCLTAISTSFDLQYSVLIIRSSNGISSGPCCNFDARSAKSSVSFVNLYFLTSVHSN